MKATFLLLLFSCVSAYGQDPAAQAIQQSEIATQQAIEASQQAIQASQQAARQTTQQLQQAAMDAPQNSVPARVTGKPAFSVPPGVVAPGTKVRLRCSTRHAVIYYTSDGWTPTIYSTRYKGPIPINADTHLEAVAVSPYAERSLVARADYKVRGQAPAAPQASISTDGVLRAGTPLRLVTGSSATSKTAQVGDPLALLLDEDVKDSDAVVISKGAPVSATITAVDRAGHLGEPGDLAFEVHSLSALGIQIPLRGGETLEGADKANTARGLILIPVVGPAALLVRGSDAEIKPGMSLTASVTADTPLRQ